MGISPIFQVKVRFVNKAQRVFQLLSASDCLQLIRLEWSQFSACWHFASARYCERQNSYHNFNYGYYTTSFAASLCGSNCLLPLSTLNSSLLLFPFHLWTALHPDQSHQQTNAHIKVSFMPHLQNDHVKYPTDTLKIPHLCSEKQFHFGIYGSPSQVSQRLSYKQQKLLDINMVNQGVLVFRKPVHLFLALK